MVRLGIGLMLANKYKAYTKVAEIVFIIQHDQGLSRIPFPGLPIHLYLKNKRSSDGRTVDDAVIPGPADAANYPAASQPAGTWRRIGTLPTDQWSFQAGRQG